MVHTTHKVPQTVSRHRFSSGWNENSEQKLEVLNRAVQRIIQLIIQGEVRRKNKALRKPERAKTEMEVYSRVESWFAEHDEICRIDPRSNLTPG